MYELATDFKPERLTGGQIIPYVLHMFLSVIATLDLIAVNTFHQHYRTAIPLATKHRTVSKSLGNLFPAGGRTSNAGRPQRKDWDTGLSSLVAW